MDEIWKDVIGYEGYYQVSNLGNVKSLDRSVIGINNVKQNIKGVLLKPATNSTKYFSVCFYKYNKSKTHTIHTLVAKAFIDNPLNKRTVNHIDSNRKNNIVSNLEWATHQENIKHGFKYGHMNNDMHKKKVEMVTLDGIVLKTFDSLTNASKYIGVAIANISICCRCDNRTAKGYKWRFVND